MTEQPGKDNIRMLSLFETTKSSEYKALFSTETAGSVEDLPSVRLVEFNYNAHKCNANAVLR